MSFLEPLFLYFLPAALIPLILSLFYRMNRRKLTFPSLMLLEELIKDELNKRKMLFRLRRSFERWSYYWRRSLSQGRYSGKAVLSP
jgi:hypothetical protein